MSSPTALAAVSAPESSASGVAPAWHTAIVLGGLLGLSLLGAHLDLRAIGLHDNRVTSYLIIVVIEWATVAFIWWAVSRRGIRLSDLVGGSWARGIQVLRDLGIALAFLVVCGGAVEVLGQLLKIETPQSMREMLPQSPLEMVVWVGVSLTGGICEEVIFRGYLQRQFSTLTRSVAGGIVLQAIAFGLCHGYQGWKLMAMIALYGGCFGVLARWRQSLRPGMVAHALQDCAGGLLARFMGS
jgi:uncharacterized protein